MFMYFFVLLTIGLALLKGGEPERYGALGLLGISALCALDHYLMANGGGQFRPLTLSFCTWECIFGLAGFTIIALSAWRIWPLWAAALQLLANAAAVCERFNFIITEKVLCTMQDMVLAMTTFVLFLGTLAIWQGRSRIGKTRDWYNWMESIEI